MKKISDVTPRKFFILLHTVVLPIQKSGDHIPPHENYHARRFRRNLVDIFPTSLPELSKPSGGEKERRKTKKIDENVQQTGKTSRLLAFERRKTIKKHDAYFHLSMRPKFNIR